MKPLIIILSVFCLALAPQSKFEKHKASEKFHGKLRYHEQAAEQAFKKEVSYAYRRAMFDREMQVITKDPQQAGLYASLYGEDPEEHLLEKYSIIKTICMYCNIVVEYKDGEGTSGTSHGVCIPHFKAMMKELEATPVEVDRKEPTTRA